MSSSVLRVALTDMYSVFDYGSQQEGVYTDPVLSGKLNDVYVSLPDDACGPVFRKKKIYRLLALRAGERVVLWKKIFDRKEQLVRSEASVFLRGRELFLAKVIEGVYARILLLQDHHLLFLKHKKNSFSKNSLFVDPKSECFHVFLRKNQSEMDSGTFKHIFASISVPFSYQKNVFFTVRKINQIRKPTCENQLPLSDPLEETRVSLKYNHGPRVYCAAMYPSKGGRIDTIEEKCFSLYDALSKQVLQEDEVLKVACDLLQDLFELHSSDLVHMDISLPNALLKKQKTQIKAVWTDFGMAIKLGCISRKASPLQVGSYGSFAATPPEGLYGVPLEGDLFKLDAWAFGIFLYELLFCSTPQWVNLLEQYRKSKLKSEGWMILPQEVRRECMDLIDEELFFITERYSAERNTLKKSLLCVCLHLLEQNPQARWSLIEAKHYLDEIESFCLVTEPKPRSAPLAMACSPEEACRSEIKRSWSC